MEGVAMQDELDKNLQSLFGELRHDLSEEPFVENVAKLINQKRARRVFLQKAVLVAGVILCGLSSRYLVKSSALISEGLDALFKIAGSFASSPLGMLSAIVAFLLLFLFKRRWISTLL
jgi:hypothetical protein